jgi:hypothetical protein
MEQKRVPEAAPEWPSVELGIGEKRSFRKGSKSAFYRLTVLAFAVETTRVKSV